MFFNRVYPFGLFLMIYLNVFLISWYRLNFEDKSRLYVKFFQLRPYQPNCVQSSSNFQDMPLSNYQHICLCSTLPNPSSIQSGTINIFQPPCNQNLFLSQSLAELSLLGSHSQKCYLYYSALSYTLKTNLLGQLRRLKAIVLKCKSSKTS